jgi:hypothetical protein
MGGGPAATVYNRRLGGRYNAQANAPPANAPVSSVRSPYGRTGYVPPRGPWNTLEQFVSAHEPDFGVIENSMMNAATLDPVHLYEFVVAGQTYLDLENVIGGEPVYQTVVTNFLNNVPNLSSGGRAMGPLPQELWKTKETTKYGEPILRITEQKEEYADHIDNVMEAFQTVTDPAVYQVLEEETNALIVRLEPYTRTPGTATMLRTLVKISVYLSLLKRSEAMAIALRPELDQMVEYYQQ